MPQLYLQLRKEIYHFCVSMIKIQTNFGPSGLPHPGYLG